MTKLSSSFIDSCDTDYQSLTKRFQRHRQGRQLGRMPRIENATNFLLVLVEHDRQLRLAPSRGSESIENSQLRCHGGLDADIGIDRISVELSWDADAIRSNRQRFTAHRIGKKGKPQGLLPGAFGVLNRFRLRDGFRDIRKAHGPISFFAPLNHRAIEIGPHLHLPYLDELARTGRALSVEAKRFSDLGGRLRIDLPARQRRNAIPYPNHRVSAFTARLRHAEWQFARSGLIPQLRNKPVSFVQIVAPDRDQELGQICPNVKLRSDAALLVTERDR